MSERAAGRAGRPQRSLAGAIEEAVWIAARLDVANIEPVPGRRFSESVQQAVEVLDGVPVSESRMVLRAIPVATYYGEYAVLSGLANSALPTSQLAGFYSVEVVRVHRHSPPRSGIGVDVEGIHAALNVVCPRHDTASRAP